MRYTGKIPGLWPFAVQSQDIGFLVAGQPENSAFRQQETRFLGTSRFYSSRQLGTDTLWPNCRLLYQRLGAGLSVL